MYPWVLNTPLSLPIPIKLFPNIWTRYNNENQIIKKWENIEWVHKIHKTNKKSENMSSKEDLFYFLISTQQPTLLNIGCFLQYFDIKFPLTEMHVVFRRTTTEKLIQRWQSVCTQFSRYVSRGIPPMMWNVIARSLFCPRKL